MLIFINCNNLKKYKFNLKKNVYRFFIINNK